MTDFRNKPRIARHSGSPIARARMARGWTQGQLAEAIGSTQSQVAGWESGRRNPKLDALIGIANALGIELNDLIGGSTMIYDLIINRNGVQAMRDGYHKHVDKDLSMKGVYNEDDYTIVEAANGNSYRISKRELNSKSIQDFLKRLPKK